MLQNNRNDFKGALCNQINVGSCVQAELLAVAKLLIVAANEEWTLNAKIVVFVRPNQSKTWLNKKKDCCLDLRFIWNELKHNRSRFKSICFTANKNTPGSIMWFQKDFVNHHQRTEAYEWQKSAMTQLQLVWQELTDMALESFFSFLL